MIKSTIDAKHLQGGFSFLSSANKTAQIISDFKVTFTREERLAEETAVTFAEANREMWDTPEEDKAWAHLQ